MPYPLSFRIRHNYGASNNGATLLVSLNNGKDSVRVFAKIDTGADYCFFEKSLANDLNLDLERGRPLVASTVAGQFRAYGYEVTLSVFDIQVNSFVYFFADDQIQRNVLGRNGWLNRVRLGLVEHDSLIYLSAYDD